MSKLIRETEQLKYRVISAKGKTLLAEAYSVFAAERFLETLTEEEREGANIVPITAEGKQILHG